MALPPEPMMRGRVLIAWVRLAALIACVYASANDLVTMSLRDVELAEAMEMLSRTREVNILLGDSVEATVTINLYDIALEDAISAIASAAGYAVEKRFGSFFVVDHEDVGRHSASNFTDVHAYKIRYSDPEAIAEILANFTSVYGQVAPLAEKGLVIMQDTPEFLARLKRLALALDRRPKQILIETQILEVTLDDSHSYGIDWRRLFNSGTGTVGTRDLAASDVQGLFLEVMNSDIEVVLDALVTEGRARTLSTPKLLALEDELASVIVGDRKGYRETTTINQVTSESIRFLESGVILRVTPSVDEDNRIRLSVQPEISTGTVSDGIPSQVTTAVSTELLLMDGQTSFIAGLIKRSLTNSQSGVPILHKIPVLGGLFRNRDQVYVDTETVVLITPRIVDQGTNTTFTKPLVERIDTANDVMDKRVLP